MTAGSGILHQEMPHGDADGRMHGFQLWANLPAADKMAAPRYQDISASDVPEVTDDDLAELYAEADLFTLFSRYEAFGLVYLEAMAHCTPVLTQDVGANRELLTRGAVVVERFDEDEAVDALVRFVNDGDYRHKLAEDAQDYALSEFTWPAVSEKYLGVYAGTSLE